MPRAAVGPRFVALYFLRGRTPLDRVTPWGLDRARSYRVGAHKQPYAEAGRPSAPRRALFGPGDTPAHCTGCGMSGCSYIRQQPLSCSREVRLTYPTPRVRARPRTPTYIFPALLAVSRSANRPLFFTPGGPTPPSSGREAKVAFRESLFGAPRPAPDAERESLARRITPSKLHDLKGICKVQARTRRT